MPMGPMGEELPYADEGADSEDFARSILELINEWRMVEQDEEDLLMIEKLSTQVQQLLARNQKESRDALSGKASPRLLQQAYGA